jgi:tetratricopeptide (TPR) repeat protein
MARDRAALNRLAGSIDPAAQPVQTLNLIATYLYWFRDKEDDAAPIRFLKRAQPHHPDNFHINHSLAWFLANRAQQYAASEPYCLAAIAVRPRSSAAWLVYASVLKALKRHAEAVAAYRRVADLAPRAWSFRMTAGSILEEQGRKDEALAEYRAAAAAAVKLSGGYITADMVAIWVKHGLMDDVIAGLRRANHSDRPHPATLPLLTAIADAYCAQGRFADAGWAYDRAVEIAPENSSLGMRWAVARLLAGDPTGHRKAARILADRFRKTAVAGDAERAAKTGLLDPAPPNHEDYVALADRALGLKPPQYMEYYLMSRGLAALRERQWTQAINYCSQSRAAGGPRISSYLLAADRAIEALALTELGRMPDARTALAEAERLSGARGPSSGAAWVDEEIARLLAREARQAYDRHAPPPAKP